MNVTLLAHTPDPERLVATAARLCYSADDVATIDAQPVKHGRWVELPKAINPNENPCQCSNCKHVVSFYGGYPKSKFCGECGSKMDGDSK